MKTTDSLNGKAQPLGVQRMISQWIQTQKAYGIAYLYAWLHRFTGVGLLLFLWVHIYTLSFLVVPDKFDSKMEWLNHVGLYHLEWLLALPVIFHALNGGRLILYEIFNNRQDGLLSTWVAGLTIIYAFILLLIMYASRFSITPSMWNITWLFSLGVAGIVIIGTSASKIRVPWKLQRISGGFLMLMIPVHMVLMHANPLVGHDSASIITRIQSDLLIRVADFSIVVCALYHGAYGLVSITKDYLKSGKQVQFVVGLVGIVSIFFAWLGIKTIILL